MIICPVCNKENHHLAGACTACGSFLQQRVENLDLFATIGHIVDAPGKTFHTIAVARHKNFIYILSALYGWPVVFTVFWYIHAGEQSTSLLTFLTAGFAIGPVVGLTLFLYAGLLLWIAARIMRSKISFRNAVATLVYSAAPFLLVFFIYLPMVILTYGLYFFTKNPSPYDLKPLSFIIIVSLAGLSYLWSASLLLVGIRIVTGTRWYSSLAIWFLTLIVVGGTVAVILASVSGWSR
jgi:hypothetical protein